ncbi:hypothetical protein ACRWYO_25760, partial [Escherichia coli]
MQRTSEKICLLFIRLTSNVLKLFPFAMVICPVVWFYLCPEHIISDIVNDWQDADILEKILLVRLYGFAPIFPDTCYHLTHYWPAAADIPVASDNPVH